MKILNKKLQGGPHPLFACACGAQIDPQAAPAKPVVQGRLWCGTTCGYYPLKGK